MGRKMIAVSRELTLKRIPLTPRLRSNLRRFNAKVRYEAPKKLPFDPKVFLSKVNGDDPYPSTTIIKLFYEQGKPADSVFRYTQRLTRAATMPKGLSELIASIRNKTESNNCKPESAVELLT